MGVSPIWVNLNRAAKFPEINAVYKRAGGGQGSGQGSSGATVPKSATKGFLNLVKKLVQNASNGIGGGIPSWIRKMPAGSNDWQNTQVDVTNIPGVRPLNDNGKWQSFQA